jgi:hypothetical protein
MNLFDRGVQPIPASEEGYQGETLSRHRPTSLPSNSSRKVRNSSAYGTFGGTSGSKVEPVDSPLPLNPKGSSSDEQASQDLRELVGRSSIRIGGFTAEDLRRQEALDQFNKGMLVFLPEALAKEFETPANVLLALQGLALQKQLNQVESSNQGWNAAVEEEDYPKPKPKNFFAQIWAWMRNQD